MLGRRNGPVGGPETAQRAELTAAVHANSAVGAPLELVSDSRHVCHGVAALRAGASPTEWTHADLWELLRPHCETGFIETRWVKRDRARGPRGQRDRRPVGGRRRARACLSERALCVGRQVQLHALRSLQRRLAAVELAALRANHEGSGPAGPRVRRRWTGGPRLARAAQPSRHRAQQQQQAPAADPQPQRQRRARRPWAVGQGSLQRGAAETARARFGGGAWTPHAASQGPGWVACLCCGSAAPHWQALTARPCPGWASVLPPRAAALLLVPAVRAGGQQGGLARGAAQAAGGAARAAGIG